MQQKMIMFLCLQMMLCLAIPVSASQYSDTGYRMAALQSVAHDRQRQSPRSDQNKRAITKVQLAPQLILASNNTEIQSVSGGGQSIDYSKLEKESAPVIPSVQSGSDQRDIVLVIQSAQTATLLASKTNPGHFVLTLNKVSEVLVFSDRNPVFAGRMASPEFVRFWNENVRQISSSAPTAALVSKSFSAFTGFGSHSDVFIVQNPEYNSSRESFSYDVSVAGHYNLKQGVYKNVSLFLTQRIDKKEAGELLREIK